MTKNRDSFIKKLVGDPNNPPKTVLLTGYLGDSSETDHTRLYADAELRSFIDIPNKAILNTQETGDSLGGHYVWIAEDAELIYAQTQPKRQRGRFFEGGVMQRYGQAQRRMQAELEVQGLDYDYVPQSYYEAYCPPDSRFCPSEWTPICSRFLACPSDRYPCQSGDLLCTYIGCPTRVCISENYRCISLGGGDCTSLVDGCESALGCYDLNLDLDSLRRPRLQFRRRNRR